MKSKNLIIDDVQELFDKVVPQELKEMFAMRRMWKKEYEREYYHLHYAKK